MVSKLDKILSSFTKVTKQLQKFVDKSEEEINDCHVQMIEMRADLNNHTDERNKAMRVLSNVQKLIEE